MFHEVPKRADPVAVFVDGDNLSHDHAVSILGKAASLGCIVLCRVYGDMTRAGDWGCDLRFAAQHAASKSGKNHTDIRLVIDAMEYALAGRARVFVLASNDSDFAPLAVRLRELGHVVVGIGGAHASMAFAQACSEFLRVEPVVQKPVQPKLDKLDCLIRTTILEHGAAGQIALSNLGSRMGKLEKPANHGASSWRGLLKARADRFTLDGEGAATVVRLHPALISG